MRCIADLDDDDGDDDDDDDFYFHKYFLGFGWKVSHTLNVRCRGWGGGCMGVTPDFHFSHPHFRHSEK